MSTLREQPPAGCKLDEAGWRTVLTVILPSVHPVDRTATRIWFAFWPLKLRRILADRDETEAIGEYKLEGGFRLEDRLAASMSFLYGARYWAQVARAVVAQVSEIGSSDPDAVERNVRLAAGRAASAVGIADDLVLGVTAVAFMALQQVGPAVLMAVEPPSSFAARARSPEAVMAARRPRRKQNAVGRFLRPRSHRVTWHEDRPEATFPALEGQNLTMAAAQDRRDHRARDPRCVEGPVPVQCRSGACGTCWIGVLSGRCGLSEITPFERQRLRHFGYASEADLEEPHPHVRLACQCVVRGDVRVLLPPWNGLLLGRD